MFLAVSLLLLAACVFPAAGKLLGHPKMRESATKFGIPWRRYQLIAAPELAAAAGVLVGLVWRPAGLLAAGGMTEPTIEWAGPHNVFLTFSRP